MVSWVTMPVFIYEWLSSVAFIVVACFTMISVAVSVVARLGMTASVYAWHSSVAPPMVACLRVTVFNYAGHSSLAVSVVTCLAVAAFI